MSSPAITNFEKVFSMKDYMTSMVKFLTPQEAMTVANISKKVSKNPYYTPPEPIKLNDNNYKFLKSSKTKPELVNATLKVPSLKNLIVPRGVKHIIVEGDEKIQSKVSLPVYVKKLTFASKVTFDQKDRQIIKFSDTIEELEFREEVKGDLRLVQFPANMRVFTFRPGESAPNLEGVAFSSALEEMYLGYEYYGDISKISGLENLRVLEMVYGPSTHHKELGSIPSFLEELYISPAYTKNLEDYKLPETLRVLKIGSSWDAPVNKINYPSQLEEFQIIGKYSEDLKLPETINSLTLDWYKKIPIVPFPDTVESITLKLMDINGEIKFPNIPTSLKSLIIRKSGFTIGNTFDVGNLQFPDGFEHLEIDLSVRVDNLDKISLPDSVKYLSLNCPAFSSFHFPSDLETLIIKTDELDEPSLSELEHLQFLEIDANKIWCDLPKARHLNLNLQNHKDLTIPEGVHQFKLVTAPGNTHELRFPSTLENLEINLGTHNILGNILDHGQLPNSLRILIIRVGAPSLNIFPAGFEYSPNLEVFTLTYNSKLPAGFPNERPYKYHVIDYRKLPSSLKVLKTSAHIQPLQEDFASYLPNLEVLESGRGLDCNNTVFPPFIRKLSLPIAPLGDITYPEMLEELETNTMSLERFNLKRPLEKLTINVHKFEGLQNIIDSLPHIGTLEFKSQTYRHRHGDSEFLPIRIHNVEHFKSSSFGFYNDEDVFIYEEPLKSISYIGVFNKPFELPSTLEVLDIPGYVGPLNGFKFPPNLRQLMIKNNRYDLLKGVNLPEGTVIKFEKGGNDLIYRRKNPYRH